MAAPNHNTNNTEFYVHNMVFDRLPMLEDNQTNKDKLGRFTLEIMYELEPCFRAKAKTDPPAEANIGNETNYDIRQRSVVADLVAVKVLMFHINSQMFGDNSAGTGTGTGNPNKVLTKAKAGSAETAWEQFDIKKSATGMSATDLMDKYKKDAIRKAHALGCLIDICEDCTMAVQSMQAGATLKPFIVSKSCGC